ncbi:MAG: glycosyltransferase family 39 protein [Candidatus Shapirobacteria bacterium]|jgi:hypothetical protein
MKKGFYWLILLLLVGLFFRVYNFEKSFSFAHDQDLYSWIAKDLLINGHQRLVGQITSVDGVFIGSAYYYLMALFYRIFDMNPLSAIIPLTLIGLFNIWSIYYIFTKHFGKKAGVVGGLIWAMSFGIAHFERWSVPTEPTFTWAIWFLATILELLRGNYKFLAIYAFLVAYIWQLHIALLPITPLPLIAWIISKNRGTLKNVLGAGLILLVFISPLLMFEVRHNFSQTKSIIGGFSKDMGGPTGERKFLKVIDASGRELQTRLAYGFEIKQVWLFWLVISGISLVLIRNKGLNGRQVGLIWAWIGLTFLAQFTSKRIVSEYYFSNLIPPIVLLVCLGISKLNKSVLIIILFGYGVVNIGWLINKTDGDQSYFYRKQIVGEIKNDAIKNNYPCVAVNFIADPGVGVGFRYLFWYQGVKLVRPGVVGVPIYNISIPWQIVEKENPIHYGRFGVLIPKKPSTIADKAVCDKEENQLDPLLGYVE